MSLQSHLVTHKKHAHTQNCPWDPGDFLMLSAVQWCAGAAVAD